MQKLSEKIAIMLDKGEDHILWMNFRFDVTTNDHGTTRLEYENEHRQFFCNIDFPPNNKYYVSFLSNSKFGFVHATKMNEDVDQAWHEALREFRRQTMLTQCNMIVAVDDLVNVCNHFLKSDESFADLIIPKRQ